MEKELHGSSLVCGTFNPLLPHLVLEDSITLQALYAPNVTLVYGSGIDYANIREGEDVYMECIDDSRPTSHTLRFFKNGLEISESRIAGRIISDNILVLQNITKADSGQYSCSADNEVGSQTSSVLWLTVKYVPRCGQQEQESIGMSLGDSKIIGCPVLSNPQNLTFHWFFNSTPDFKEYLNLPATGVPGYQVQYLVRNSGDYGSLLCYGENSVGYQESPCIFHIIPSGPPAQPINCSVLDPDPRQINIACTPGYDGGIKQKYVCELYSIDPHDADDHVLSDPADESGGEGEEGPHPEPKLGRMFRNLSNEEPIFTLYNLEPGTRFVASIYAVNSKGSSKRVYMKASTVKETFRLPLLTKDEGSAVDLDTPNLIIQQENIENKQNKMFLYMGIAVCCTSVCAVLNLICGWKLYRRRRGIPSVSVIDESQRQSILGMSSTEHVHSVYPSMDTVHTMYSAQTNKGSDCNDYPLQDLRNPQIIRIPRQDAVACSLHESNSHSNRYEETSSELSVGGLNRTDFKVSSGC
ncbi:uncharacterized protein LOC111709655 [Eurytemora carolleeae]|uniref:uncharacterized protein LOC111709655 n=1 Tax=Eurytemora carolleeae TaxID=1294199 RepID=UPI000C77A939|nr:uncharacterized protein LOC111709655 [Eurytemora carolleeae]|eukprot:XP_023339206.1 uncharacterized protein LOC111709655 [Eurytemora affinis]